MTDPIRDLIAAARDYSEGPPPEHPGDRASWEKLRAAISAAEARPAPTQCRPECTTMATDCDYCRPAPAAEPSIIPALRKVAQINCGGDTSRALDVLCDAVEALAREVRRG